MFSDVNIQSCFAKRLKPFSPENQHEVKDCFQRTNVLSSRSIARQHCTSFAQELSAPNIPSTAIHQPPGESRPQFYCLWVQCKDANSYTLVKGMGYMYPGDLWDRINYVCPNGVVDTHLLMRRAVRWLILPR